MTRSQVLPGTLMAALLITLSFTNGYAQTFLSANKQTNLLELYTSEGCSSCPPADRWLSTLKDDERLWKEFIPLAFHVDYWDYIGWKDRFASPTHTTRQRLYAREQGMRTVYTPGFIYNGEEWRQWFVRRYFDFPQSGDSGPLKVDINAGNATVAFMPSTEIASDLEVNIAILGFDLETDVKAGENKGDSLKHDFVVLGTRRAPLLREASGHVGRVNMPDASATAPRYGVAVWINPVGSQRPLQAVGGWLN